MKALLVVLIIFTLYHRLESNRVVLWDKSKEAFVSIFNIPEFEAYRLKMEANVDEENNRDFEGQSFKLMYFQQPNIFEFYDNDTRLTGVCGDIWTTLSKFLNFSIISIKLETEIIGYAVNNTYFVGGIGNISRKEIDVIPLSLMYPEATLAMDFNSPVWQSGFYIYADWKPKHDKFWIIKVFSWQVWCTVGAIQILLTICSFLTEHYSTYDKKMSSTIGEHCFYNFAALCNQNSAPDNFNSGSATFQVTLSLYRLLLYASFTALLYSHLTYRIADPPFVDLRTLLDNSDYHVAVLEDSIPHRAFKLKLTAGHADVVKRNRLTVAKTLFELSNLICDDPSRKTKYATILDEITKKTMKSNKCDLHRLGNRRNRGWLAPSVRRDFPYKKAIDILLVRMRETGVIDGLNERWLERKNMMMTKRDRTDAVAIDHIFLPSCLYAGGVGISVLILFFEICVYHFKTRHSHPLMQR